MAPKKSAAPKAKKSAGGGSTIAGSGKSAVAGLKGTPKKKAGGGKGKSGEDSKDDNASSDVASSPPKDPMSQDDAVSLVQNVGRGFSDRIFVGQRHMRRLRDRLNEKAEDRISKAIAFERKRQQKSTSIQKEAQTKEEKKIKLMDALCVAAFDGEVAKMKEVIRNGANPHGKDQQGNYPLGEASVNGQVEVVKALIDLGCDPNCRGAYERTPLWRAAFNSHEAAIQCLLERGADPRLKAQADLPEEICNDACKAIFQKWDVSKTDTLLKDIEKRVQAEEEKRQAAAKTEADGLEGDVNECKQKLEIARKKLLHAKCECEKRITEYDLLNNDPSQKPELVEVALKCVQDAEKLIDDLEPEVEEAQHAYLNARAVLAQHNHDELGEELVGVEVQFKMIQDTVLQDGTSQWRKAKKWPLLIDPTGKSGTYLRYRDTNVVDSFVPSQLEPDRLRKSILGSLKYGKPLVIDLRDVPVLDSIRSFFDALEPKLWDAVIDQSICEPEVYQKLTRDEDGDQYAAQVFSKHRIEEFLVLILTSAVIVEEELSNSFFAFRVEME